MTNINPFDLNCKPTTNGINPFDIHETNKTNQKNEIRFEDLKFQVVNPESNGNQNNTENVEVQGNVENTENQIDDLKIENDETKRENQINELKCITRGYKITTYALGLNFIFLSICSMIYLIKFYTNNTQKRYMKFSESYLIIDKFVHLAVYSSIPSIIIIVWIVIWQFYMIYTSFKN